MIRELLVDLMMGKLVDIECIVNSSNMHLCVCVSYNNWYSLLLLFIISVTLVTTIILLFVVIIVSVYSTVKIWDMKAALDPTTPAKPLLINIISTLNIKDYF